MRVLVTGAGGQLGRSLQSASQGYLHDVVFATKQDLDICNPAAVSAHFATQLFDICINTAAYTQVDRAEQETEQAHLLNSVAPEIIASVCAEHHCILIHVSTDYVYHNGLRRPLKEDDPVHPASVYAQTKLTGEQRAMAVNPKTIVIRTSWVFSEYGQNFVKTMTRLIGEGKSLRIVNDQTGCPTYAGDLAHAMFSMINILSADMAAEKYGVFNYCNRGETTWYDFAQEIATLLGLEPSITPVSTGEYGAAAPRPLYSVLDTSRISSVFGITAPHWKSGLDKTLKNLAG